MSKETTSRPGLVIGSRDFYKFKKNKKKQILVWPFGRLKLIGEEHGASGAKNPWDSKSYGLNILGAGC